MTKTLMIALGERLETLADVTALVALLEVDVEGHRGLCR
jgi:hypothetical protein